MPADRYHVYLEGDLQELSLRELVGYLREHDERPAVWSARLSTGLLGLTDCAAGNRGPKGPAEVVLAVGDRGLVQLVDLGFIPCPVCRPEDEPGFWEVVDEAVQERYALEDIHGFADKEVVGYDARQLDREELLPVTGAPPNRLYVPADLGDADLVALKERFATIGYELPPVGCYDRDAPGNFREYAIPG